MTRPRHGNIGTKHMNYLHQFIRQQNLVGLAHFLRNKESRWNLLEGLASFLNCFCRQVFALVKLHGQLYIIVAKTTGLTENTAQVLWNLIREALAAPVATVVSSRKQKKIEGENYI